MPLFSTNHLNMRASLLSRFMGQQNLLSYLYTFNLLGLSHPGKGWIVDNLQGVKKLNFAESIAIDWINKSFLEKYGVFTVAHSTVYLFIVRIHCLKDLLGTASPVFWQAFLPRGNHMRIRSVPVKLQLVSLLASFAKDCRCTVSGSAILVA